MSAAVTNQDAMVVRLRQWLKERNPKLTDTDLDVDRDLVAAHALDSLSMLDFILFVEELSGQEIDTSTPTASANFRTLGKIREAYFSSTMPDSDAQPRPSSRKSLSVIPPKFSDASESTLADGTRVLPLTASQARYWYLEEKRPETAWNVPAVTHIVGPLDPLLLRSCLAEVVRRHDGLRTQFRVIDGKPMQVIVPPFTPDIRTFDLSEKKLDDPWGAALKVVERECAVPYDLADGPPWGARLVRLDKNEHVCLVSLHHLIADLESLLTIPREIGRIYGALQENRNVSLPPPPMQFSDFSEWHEEWLTTEGAKEQVELRKAQFADARPIDLGRGRTATKSVRENYKERLSEEIATALEALAADERATPVAVAIAAASSMLFRKFKQSDLVIMMVSSYRSAGRKTSGVLGNFTNQLPLRIKLSPDMPFRELLGQVRNSVVEVMKSRDVPTQLIFGTENPLDHPLASVLVNWMNLVDYGDGMREVRARDTVFKPIMLGVGGASSVPLHGGNPPFASLVVRAVRMPQGIDVFVTTAHEAAPEGMAKELAQELGRWLTKIAKDRDVRVGA